LNASQSLYGSEMRSEGGLPTKIGPYEIDGEIGQGALGALVRARHEEGGEVVALRILKPVLASDPVYIERLGHQLEQVRGLDHPGLSVPIAWGSFDGTYVVASTLARGEPLSGYPTDEPIETMPAGVIIADIAGALAALHGAGVVHQSVNADKVVIGPEGHATLVGAGMVSAGAYSMLTTRFDQVMGDVNYLAPELIRGFEPGPGSDVYALACIAFRCLGGSTPFEHLWLYEIPLAHLERTPPRLEEVAADVPPAWAGVVNAALADDPDDRPTARGFVDAFASIT
jgi:serine/threonine protein kinase